MSERRDSSSRMSSPTVCWAQVTFLTCVGIVTFVGMSSSVNRKPIASPRQPTNLGASCATLLTVDNVIAQAACIHAISILYTMWFSSLPPPRRVRFTFPPGSRDVELGQASCGCAPSIGRLVSVRRSFAIMITAVLVMIWPFAANDPPLQVVASMLLFLSSSAAFYHMPATNKCFTVPYAVITMGTAFVWCTCSTAWSAGLRMQY